MGPIGIHSKDAEGTAEVTVRFSLLKGYGDHGRPMMSWKRKMLDPFSKRARRIFQGCSIGCSASLLMVIIFQSSPVSMLGHCGLGVWTTSWLEKTLKTAVTKVIRGLVRNSWWSWRRDTLRGTLEQPVAVCKEAASEISVVCSLQWCKAGQWHTASLEIEI